MHAAGATVGLSGTREAVLAESRGENSIAVLPFADLSEDGSQGYFSDGIAEEILNVLAKVEGLHVAARTSSFAFREPNTDIREIGRLLNVSTVLEGSIRKAGVWSAMAFQPDYRGRRLQTRGRHRFRRPGNRPDDRGKSG